MNDDEIKQLRRQHKELIATVTFYADSRNMPALAKAQAELQKFEQGLSEEVRALIE